MKNAKIILSVLIAGVLMVSGVALAKTTKTNSQENQRVYVLTKNPAIKAALGVNHEFSNGFSTKVSPRLKVMESLGLIKTEPVQIYHISGKPFCGDGRCTGKETPENCLVDCKNGGEEPSPTTRICRPSEKIPWGTEKVNGGSGGAGINVAVLDTGVYKDHLDLKDNVIDCKDMTKRGIKDGCADGNGHGTHVSGTILANGGSDDKGIHGVAPEAKLMAIKVCGSSGSCQSDDIATGIKYAANNGANIISMSLGGDTQSPLIKEAINDAVNAGVLVVAAAGNDGPTYGSIDYPGANVKVIAVGAIDSLEAVPYWSSRGVNDNDWTIEEKEIEFAAPGVDVESTWNNGCYHTISGTSMATPHIAGIAARDWQSNYDTGEYNNAAEATRAHLQNLAKTYTLNTINGHDYGQLGDDIEAGFGLPITPPITSPIAPLITPPIAPLITPPIAPLITP